MTRTATFKEPLGSVVFVLVAVSNSLNTLNIFIVNLFRKNIFFLLVQLFLRFPLTRKAFLKLELVSEVQKAKL